ncbi:MAG: cell division protein ZapA, partial [Syntrophomonas sp.]|nr:cell division protein ZapA [Syntrophomonas sp.]
MVEGIKNNVNKVTVEIFNQEYVVKGNENAEYMEMLAAYVDRRMRMIGQRNNSLTITKVAVLTAL